MFSCKAMLTIKFVSNEELGFVLPKFYFSVWYSVDHCLSFWCFFLLVIALSVLLLFTASYYPFSIFNRFCSYMYYTSIYIIPSFTPYTLEPLGTLSCSQIPVEKIPCFASAKSLCVLINTNFNEIMLIYFLVSPLSTMLYSSNSHTQ